MSKDNHIVYIDNTDTEINQAYAQARHTFKYFWRELYWEYRRIIPALDFAMVKTKFTQEINGKEEAEHMWINDIRFDGIYIHGTLVNDPAILTNIKNGASVRVLSEHISDWLFLCDGVPYGGFTVQTARKHMTPTERAEYDLAWGIDFGDPEHTPVAYEQDSHPENLKEHPMCRNCCQQVRDHFNEHPDTLNDTDEHGYTALHLETIAGNGLNVAILLELGADPALKTDSGYTAADFAERLQWDNILPLFGRRPAART